MSTDCSFRSNLCGTCKKVRTISGSCGVKSTSAVLTRRFNQREHLHRHAKRRIKEPVIKSAASAASLGFAGERPVPRRPHAGPSSWRSPANPRQAALAADFITALLIRFLVVPGQCLVEALGSQHSEFSQLAPRKRTLSSLQSLNPSRHLHVCKTSVSCKVPSAVCVFRRWQRPTSVKWPFGPKPAYFSIFLCFGGRYKVGLGKKWAERNYFAPAGSLRRKSEIFPGIQKVDTLSSWILGLNWVI